MARTFIALTADDVDNMVAENILARERELAAYDFEAESHAGVIAELKNLEWDSSTTKYRGMSRDEMIFRGANDGLDSAAIQQVLNLNLLDMHKMHAEAVKAEISKAERSYNKLLERLPEGNRRDTALATAITKIAK